MKKFFASRFPKNFLPLLLSVASAVEARDLREQAASELDLAPTATRPKDAPRRATHAQKAETTVVPVGENDDKSPAYLQSVLPDDERARSRPKWTFEIGVENQRPRGELQAATLSALDLGQFPTQVAYGATLAWWFGDALEPVWGPRWRSALAAQFAWSRHRYSLDLQGPTGPVPSPARLQVLRPQLGALVEYRVLEPEGWNTEFWLGAEAGAGRLMQSQTSRDSDLLNLSKNLNYWEWGTQLRSVVAENFLVNLQYRQRVFARQEGNSHHGIFSLGIAL